MPVAPPSPSHSRTLRKFRAVRSPEKPKRERGGHETPELAAEHIITSTPWLAGTRRLEGATRTEIYALVNDRSVSGRDADQDSNEENKKRSVSGPRRESSRKSAAKSEWEHLGLHTLGKKRKSSSPYASEAGSTAGSDSESTLPASRGSRTRRVTSRHSTPVHTVELETLSSRLNAANAPAHPSPLATHAILAEDSPK